MSVLRLALYGAGGVVALGAVAIAEVAHACHIAHAQDAGDSAAFGLAAKARLGHAVASLRRAEPFAPWTVTCKACKLLAFTAARSRAA